MKVLIALVKPIKILLGAVGGKCGVLSLNSDLVEARSSLGINYDRLMTSSTNLKATHFVTTQLFVSN